MTDEAEFEATAERLVDTLAAVARATPSVDRSNQLLDRLDAIDAHEAYVPSASADGPDAVDELGRPAQPRSATRTPRFLLAAAAVVLVTLAVVVVVGNDDDPNPSVATPGTEVNTGWYLPPEGWTVVSVDAEFTDVQPSCPCTTWVAARTDGEPATIVVGESFLPAEVFAEAGAVDVDGRTGSLDTLEGVTYVWVVDAGRPLVVAARGVDEEIVIDLADDWLDQRDAGREVDADRLVLPEGFERTDPMRSPPGTFHHLLVIRVREDTTGNELEYRVAPPGELAPGAILEGGELDFRAGVLVAAFENESGRFVASTGGGADLELGPSYFGESTSEISAEALRAFFDELREVPTSTWRTELTDSGAEVSPLVLEAPTLEEAPLTD